MPVLDTELAAAFRAAQLDVCAELRRETDYNPARFEQEVRARTAVGAVAFTAHLILNGPPEGAAGFRRMLALRRAHQTVEWQVLLPQWRPLFEPNVRAVARWRLRTSSGVFLPAELNHDD